MIRLRKLQNFKNIPFLERPFFLSNFKFTAILRQYKTFPHNPFYHLYNILVHIVPSQPPPVARRPRDTEDSYLLFCFQSRSHVFLAFLFLGPKMPLSIKASFPKQA